LPPPIRIFSRVWSSVSRGCELGAESGERGEEKNVETSFRFQKLEIWQRGADVGQALFDVAEELDSRKAYRWAEQLRSAALSITNNIAEGSGSYSKTEFAQFLNFARRSTFECANILLQLIPRLEGRIPLEPLLKELEEISRMIHAFRKTLF
jgi:four helix bundle protein